MKKQIKKLTLRAEIVRTLDSRSLIAAAGGLEQHPRTYGCLDTDVECVRPPTALCITQTK